MVKSRKLTAFSSTDQVSVNPSAWTLEHCSRAAFLESASTRQKTSSIYRLYNGNSCANVFSKYDMYRFATSGAMLGLLKDKVG